MSGQINAHRRHLRCGLDEPGLAIGKFLVRIKSDDDRALYFAIYVERGYVFFCVIGAVDQKFIFVVLEVTDLGRHKAQPLFKPLTTEKILIQLTLASKCTAYQPDALKLCNKDAS